MNIHPKTPSTALLPITLTWITLCLLTVLSLGLGKWFHGANWLPLLVALIVWVKGMMIAHYFIEAELTHAFIRRVLKVFIAFAPLWLILTGFFGGQFAQWGLSLLRG